VPRVTELLARDGLLAFCLTACQPAGSTLGQSAAVPGRSRTPAAHSVRPGALPPQLLGSPSALGESRSAAAAFATSAQRKPFGKSGANVALGVADPAARWVFYCQSDDNQGSASASDIASPMNVRQQTDAMRSYLACSSLGIIKLTALLSSSTDGRYLVVLSDEQEPLLIDAQLQHTTSLAALKLDLRADATRGDLRSVAFSADGSKVALLLRGQPPRVLIRELRDGADVEATPLGENVWRIEFDAAGRYLVLQEILGDTNKNGRLEWPIPERPLHNTRCMSDAATLDAWIPTGDQAVTTIVPVSGGKARRVDGFVTSLDSSLIVTQGREGLAAIGEKGKRPISTGDCDLHVVALSTQYGQILCTCSDTKGLSNLELDSLKGMQRFPFEVPISMLDWTTPEPGRFRALYSGTRTYLVDYQLARATQLQDRDQLLAQGAAGIILRRGTEVVLVNPDTSAAKTLMNQLAAGTRIVMGPGHVVVGQTILSAERGQVLGIVTQSTMAVAANGCVLVALGATPDKRPFYRGPLQWACPG
jgi:hypothetical protein